MPTGFLRGLHEPPAVVKILRRRYASDWTAITRFEREAEVVSAVAHPNCISVLDFGHTGSGVGYMVMEYLEGQSLARLLDAGRFTVGFTPTRR